MIVLDASTLVELLIGGSFGARLRTHVEADPDWVAPQHVVVEVANALRRLWLARDLSDHGFASAVSRLDEAEIRLWPVAPLLPRIVGLATHLTACDAAYVALAEELDAPLPTVDERLRSAPGTRCRFIDVSS